MFEYIKENKKETFIVLAITVFALILRVLALLNYGDLWVDELWSFYFANKSNAIQTVDAIFKEDIHAPLFFILLNFWMKIFGKAPELLRSFSLIFGVAFIPAIFYLTKDLFNRKSAYIALAFSSVSVFLIHYSRDLKFYSLVALLGLFIVYLYIKLLQNPSKTTKICYVLTASILIWTYNVGCIFVFLQAFIALIYTHKSKRTFLPQIFVVYLSILLIGSPFFIHAINIFFSQNSADSLIHLSAYFHFDLGFLNILMQNLFSNHLTSVNNNLNANYNILTNIFSLKNFIFVLIPVFICLFAIIKAICTKDKKVFLAVLPAIFFVMILIILAMQGYIVLVSRYTIIAYPALIILIGYGLSTIKNEKIFYGLVISLISINALFLIFDKKSYLNQKYVSYSPTLSYLKQNHLKHTDIIYHPELSNIMRYYWQDNQAVDFSYEKVFTDQKAQEIIFGTSLFKSGINKSNAQSKMKPYLQKNGLDKNYSNFLINNYFNTMKKGDKFILIIGSMYLLKPEAEYNQIISDENSYNKYDWKALFYTKFMSDTINVCTSKLTYQGMKVFENQNIGVLIFEKEKE